MLPREEVPMCARRIHCLAAVVPALLTPMRAQQPVLNPTSNVTLWTGGPLHYSSILIPAGVTVQFTGTVPAVLLCDGDCIVHGTLSAAASGTTDGPGAVTTGIGTPGVSCPSACGPFGCVCWGQYTAPGAGTHHGAYGSLLPFRLAGGSPGGSEAWLGHSLGCCDLFMGLFPGGGGGGTLVVQAGGRIEITGTIDVRGGAPVMFGGGLGSAGSVLLRGAAGTVLHPTGVVHAGPATSNGGYVRLDAWGSAPSVQGTIAAPPPAVLELPHLHAPASPSLGTTWLLDVYAPENTFVVLAVSAAPGVGTPTAFGLLGIDLANAVTLAPSTTPAGAPDPCATIPCPVPNAAFLLGLQVWTQALAAPPTLAPRLSNTISATVQ